MNLTKSKILIAAQYAAPYESNFIASLKVLQSKLKDQFGAECAFVFPQKMIEQPWANRFLAQHHVYLTGDKNALATSKEIDNIIVNYNPSLIYTHFEGYDTFFASAVRRTRKPIRQVWHMHDSLSFVRHPAKAIYQLWGYFIHYGAPFLKPTLSRMKSTLPRIIGVCSHEPDFIRKFRLGIPTCETILPNGILINRINSGQKRTHSQFTFLVYAGRYVDKRPDLLLRTAEKLITEGYDLRVVMVDNNSSPTISETMYDTMPEWLQVIKPKEDINEVLGMADCFVSTSINETFSYAVAEAAIFGLPVIQSDILGTFWNAKNPSTFLFKSGNVDSLAEAMRSVLNASSDDIEQKCKVTAQNIRDNFSLDSWAKKVIEFFESIP